MINERQPRFKIRFRYVPPFVEFFTITLIFKNLIFSLGILLNLNELSRLWYYWKL